MSPQKFPEDQYLIPKSELIEHAAMAALNASAQELPGLDGWQKASLRKLPTSIYDINGKLLFLDYPMATREGAVGKVRTAASAVLGSPVVALIHENAPFDIPAVTKKLKAVIAKSYKEYKLREPKLVCYSYPKLGLMFSGSDPKGKRTRLIFDIASQELIPEAGPDQKDREGAFAWSLYDSLSDDQRSEGINLVKKYTKARLEMGTANLQKIAASKNMLALKDDLVAIVPSWKTTTKQLQYCTHYLPTEARSHHCFVLHAQQVNDYCAVATCQMILCYYRYYFTQAQIAPALGYAPGGGCPSNQSAGYHNLSNHHILAAYDTSPTFAKAKTEIDGLHPFKSGISGHARACAGYSQTTWYGIVTSQSLYIYDPWPWNADYKLGGAVYWESWDSITHTNMVTTKLDY